MTSFTKPFGRSFGANSQLKALMTLQRRCQKWLWVSLALLGMSEPLGAWTTQAVDSGNTADFGAYGSLALDSAGKPAIAYFDAANGNLKLARWSGSAWTLETVNDTGIVGQ